MHQRQGWFRPDTSFIPGWNFTCKQSLRMQNFQVNIFTWTWTLTRILIYIYNKKEKKRTYRKIFKSALEKQKTILSNTHSNHDSNKTYRLSIIISLLNILHVYVYNNGNNISNNYEACNFTKSNTLPWVFFTFFKLYKWYQKASHFYILVKKVIMIMISLT